MIKNIAYGIAFISAIFQLSAKNYDHLSPKNKQQTYKSIKEKKELFLNNHCIFSDKLYVDATCLEEAQRDHSKIYNDNKEKYDALLKKYNTKLNKPSLHLRWISSTIGIGVFAGETIAKGTLIGEYSGTIENSKKQSLTYAWYDITNKKRVINAQHTGNELRFVNHNKTPNCECVYLYNPTTKLITPFYIATKNIQKNEELTVSYGSEYFSSRNLEELDSTKELSQ